LRWFYYIVKYVGLNHLKSGEKPGLQRDTFRAQLFPFPSKDVQTEIAHLLSALDAKIASNRDVNTRLEALSTGLFESWFWDFDPVVAKRDGRRPIGVPVDAIALFPSHFRESELGPIPEGWIPQPLGERFLITMGQSPPGSTYNETGDGVPFYQGRTDFGFRYPSRRVFCTSPTRYADAGDTLVSVRAPVGDANMALERCAIGRGVAAVRHKDNKPAFTYQAIRSLREEFDVFESEGTLFGAIGGEDFRRIRFPHPPDSILNAFESLVGPMDALIESNERESSALSQLRDTLLRRLLSGELTIKTAEKTIEAAV
jgi:type I restriction enzyme S subunit